MGEVQGMWRNTAREKVPIEDEGENIQKFCEISHANGSETWCLKENEMSILRRTERAMVRAMCGVKLKDRESSEELMDRLGLKDIKKIKLKKEDTAIQGKWRDGVEKIARGMR